MPPILYLGTADLSKIEQMFIRLQGTEILSHIRPYRAGSSLSSPPLKGRGLPARKDKDRWPSGLRRTPGKRDVGQKLARRFESSSIRHFWLILTIASGMIGL